MDTHSRAELGDRAGIWRSGVTSVDTWGVCLLTPIFHFFHQNFSGFIWVIELWVIFFFFSFLNFVQIIFIFLNVLENNLKAIDS